MSEGTGVWVYAVTRAGSQDIVRGQAGVAGSAARVVSESGLDVVLSDVELADFGEEPLRRNMEDLDWLEATARAHHNVIETVARDGPLVPMRLATVYRDERGAKTMLAAHKAEFAAGLDWLSGRMEWGVKAYAAPIAQPRGTTDAGMPARPSSGADYLKRRRAQLNDYEEARERAASVAEQVHAELSAMAEASDLHEPQTPPLSGTSSRMIMNATYLVDDGRASDFVTAVERASCQYPAIRLELTGPWPPYSFATTGMHPA